MDFLADKQAQIIVAGVVAVLLLIVVVAALTDGLHLLSVRQRCLEIASAAALRGTSAGRDYSGYLATGQIGLDVIAASDEAANAADAALMAMGLSVYTIHVEVLDAPGGGSIANFPPGQTWTESKPAVGVYIEAPGDTIFMQAVIGAPVTLHVFAAAGVATE